MYSCGQCRRLVVICRRCDRGQRYCSGGCSRLGRRRSMREAGRRYLRTPHGAASNAARQKRSRLRVCTTVTHHTSPPQGRARQECRLIDFGRDGSDATVGTASAQALATPLVTEACAWLLCDFCGRPCGAYSRLVPLRAARKRPWRANRRR